MTNYSRFLILALFLGNWQAFAKSPTWSTKLDGIYEYAGQDYTHVENSTPCSSGIHVTNRAGRITGVLQWGDLLPSIIFEYDQLNHSTEPKLADSPQIIKGNLSNEEFMRRTKNLRLRSYFSGQYVVSTRHTTKNGHSYQHLLIQSSENNSPDKILTREVILNGSKIIGYRDYFIQQNERGDAIPKLIGQCFPWTGERIEEIDIENGGRIYVPTGIDRNVLKAPTAYSQAFSLDQATLSEEPTTAVKSNQIK